MYPILNREEDDDELWLWRDVGSEWDGALDDPDELDQFEGALERLLEFVESKVSEDESFGGAVADSAVHALWEKLDELREARRKGVPPKDLETLIETIRLEVATNREEELVLRPEATASVCRAYIEHGMHTLPGNVKLYYMGPMFRRERPQKGRYRQFYQIGAEVLSHTGDLKEDARVDAEVIEMLTTCLGKAGLEGTALYINSIGCKECRPKYVELLHAALTKVKDKLGADSQRRIETNPLRVLDSKLESEQAIIEKLPRIAEHLCPDCLEEYTEVKKQLAMRGISYTQNFRLVRGLDYYMRTTFEITAPGLGSQNAVCGGGRYDGLVELLGGPPTKGIGCVFESWGSSLMLDSLGNLKRTHYCGELRAADDGREVVLMGWVHRRRDLGNLLFLDLRDRTGLVQIMFHVKHSPQAHEKAEVVRPEFVVAVEGKVARREKANPGLPTGEVEVIACKVHILNNAKTPPFQIEDEINASEETRLRYRYLDLRRAKPHGNLALRHKIVLEIRKTMDELGFLEIETPMLTRSTP